MARYQTTVVIDDGAEAEVDFAVTWGRPGQICGPAENCYPADPDEIDDVRVLKIDGETPPAERAAVWEVYIETHHADDLLQAASDQADDGPDPDDARDRAFDDALNARREVR
jgi:hypothetical protein